MLNKPRATESINCQPMARYTLCQCVTKQTKQNTQNTQNKQNKTNKTNITKQAIQTKQNKQNKNIKFAKGYVKLPLRYENSKKGPTKKRPPRL